MANIGTTSRPAYVYDQETDTWVPVGVGPHTHENFVTATTIDAKGDLLAGSAPDTVGRLPIGANGTMLVADATQTLGMAWANNITVNSSTDAFRITQTGSGNAFVVEDSASPDAGPFVINANGNVGIGTTTPTSILSISSDNSTQILIDRYGTDGNGGEIFGRKARGTTGSPTATQSGDTILWLGARGYGTTGFSTTSNAVVRLAAAENFTDAARGTNIIFETTPIGSTARSERMRIDSAGKVIINGTTLPYSAFAQLGVKGSAGGIVIQSAVNGIGRLFFTEDGTDGNSSIIRYNHSSDELQFFIANGTVNNQQLAVNGVGKAYLSDTSRDNTKQLRNITLSTSTPTGGNDGDVWIQYTA